ncbi:MAG: hypothetical protein DRJ44_00535 [Thermoprotei archaeon]|nr:MAG: hypothetical protein DRJ44_00535 [Thermoprotei archaeon]
MKDITLKRLARKLVRIEEDVRLIDAIRTMVENKTRVVACGGERVLTAHSVIKAVLESEGDLASFLSKNLLFLAFKAKYVSENRKLSYLVKNLKHFLLEGNVIVTGSSGKVTGYINPEDIFKYFGENFICNDINSAFFHPSKCLLVYANKSIKSTIKFLLKNGSSIVFVYSRSRYKGSVGILDLLRELVAEKILEKVSLGDDGYFLHASISELNPSRKSAVDIENIGRSKLVAILTKFGHIAILKNDGLYRAIDDKNLLLYTVNILMARSK